MAQPGILRGVGDKIFTTDYSPRDEFAPFGNKSSFFHLPHPPNICTFFTSFQILWACRAKERDHKMRPVSEGSSNGTLFIWICEGSSRNYLAKSNLPTPVCPVVLPFGVK